MDAQLRHLTITTDDDSDAGVIVVREEDVAVQFTRFAGLNAIGIPRIRVRVPHSAHHRTIHTDSDLAMLVTESINIINASERNGARMILESRWPSDIMHVELISTDAATQTITKVGDALLYGNSSRVQVWQAFDSEEVLDSTEERDAASFNPLDRLFMLYNHGVDMVERKQWTFNDGCMTVHTWLSDDVQFEGMFMVHTHLIDYFRAVSNLELSLQLENAEGHAEETLKNQLRRLTGLKPSTTYAVYWERKLLGSVIHRCLVALPDSVTCILWNVYALSFGDVRADDDPRQFSGQSGLPYPRHILELVVSRDAQPAPALFMRDFGTESAASIHPQHVFLCPPIAREGGERLFGSGFHGLDVDDSDSDEALPGTDATRNSSFVSCFETECARVHNFPDDEEGDLEFESGSEEISAVMGRRLTPTRDLSPNVHRRLFTGRVDLGLATFLRVFDDEGGGSDSDEDVLRALGGGSFSMEAGRAVPGLSGSSGRERRDSSNRLTEIDALTRDFINKE